MNRLLLTTLFAVAACPSTGSNNEASASGPSSGPSSSPAPSRSAVKTDGTQLATAPEAGLAVATFAGGCFWCMEPPFDRVEGVKSTTSGYTGGTELAPSYKQVAYGRTGHAESVRVVYDPKVVTYEKLLDVFWRNIDPTDANGQFVDRGKQYRPAIFVHNEAQKKAAEASKRALAASGKFDRPIATAIESAGDFWIAEAYHQDFYKKSPRHYYGYRRGSGRDKFIARVWGSAAVGK